MTDIEIAIKHFENVRDGAMVVLDSGFGNKPNESPTLYKRKKLNAELAIYALKKQTPEKPIRANRIIKKNGMFILSDDNEYWKCPICTKVDVVLRENQEYCHNCGQAIDWGEKV